VKTNTFNGENDNSLINAYTKRRMEMDHLSLIDVVRSRSYDKHRRGDKWLPHKTWAIVCVFPQYVSNPSCKNDKSPLDI